MRLEIGPVDVEAARSWLTHVIDGLRVVRAKADLLPFRLPDEVADQIEELLTTWQDASDATSDPFHWADDLDEERVRTLVRYWANLDSMSDELLRELGIDWSPAEGRPFFVALTTAVAAALADADLGPDPFAELLVERGDDPVRTVDPT